MHAIPDPSKSAHWSSGWVISVYAAVNFGAAKTRGSGFAEEGGGGHEAEAMNADGFFLGENETGFKLHSSNWAQQNKGQGSALACWMAGLSSNPLHGTPGRFFPLSETSNEGKGERPRRMDRINALYECDYECMNKIKNKSGRCRQLFILELQCTYN